MQLAACRGRRIIISYNILQYYHSTNRLTMYQYNIIIHKIQKHFQNVMLVGMASEISKNYTYKCVDRSRHNGIKGAKAKCAH